MMPYKHIFFDLDHTLWDFETNAKSTLEEVYAGMDLAARGVDDFNLFHQRYIAHNEVLWERYRKGLIKNDELRWKRMWLTLLDFRIGDEALARRMSNFFLEVLPGKQTLFPYTIEVLDYLRSRGYGLHIITNGFEHTQHLKLRHSGLAPYFKAVITSEGSNSLKPQKEIFDYAVQKAGARYKESIMIGDNWEVDIEGARNAGMDQVLVNHLEMAAPGTATYTVHHLRELESIF
jgi:putative hydrolase of the HAD superfamily